MKIFYFLLVILTMVGCGPVTSTIHEGDNASNYRAIFKEDVPSNVEVLNCIFVTYQTNRIAVVTTPDWEIELIAPKTWIDKIAEKRHLAPIEKYPHSVEYHLSDIKNRIDHRGREWYVPKDISAYDCYFNEYTSIVYVHMLVDKIPMNDNRYHVFLSKH